jgi:CHAT domain-containing protein
MFSVSIRELLRIFVVKNARVHPGKYFAGMFLSTQNPSRVSLALPAPSAAFLLILFSGLTLFAVTVGQESSQLEARLDVAIKSARELLHSGHAEEASKLSRRTAERAHSAGKVSQEARALVTLSAARITLFDYREAQQAAETARRLALGIHDDTGAGSAAIDLATVYLQLGDVLLAETEAAFAVEKLQNTPKRAVLAKALLIYANVEAERIRAKIESAGSSDTPEQQARDIDQIEANYLRGIAVPHSNVELSANLWEELGYSLLLVDRPERAERPLQKAYQLEVENHLENALAINRGHQAELQLRKRNYRLGFDLIEQAFKSKSLSFKTMPQFYLLHIRGVLLEHLNRENEALAELHRAADAATEWRQGALPGDATSTRTVVVLHKVYHDYAELAADCSLKTHDAALARQGLQVLAENRAANLREEITLALSRKRELPQRYFDLLAELQAAQARLTLGETSAPDKSELKRIRLELVTLQNEWGASPHDSSENSERNFHRNSLRDIQARLCNREILFSFSLGSEKSFLWAVTGDQVSVYKLAQQKEIANAVRDFSQAILRHQDSASAGRRLSGALFGSLPVNLENKSDWLIVADGPLLGGVPFASLPDPAQGQNTKFLANSHTIRFVPSEYLLLSADKDRADPRFLGVGDPIYNMADPRRAKTNGSADPGPAASALVRLAGSGREVRAAAVQSGLKTSEILTGQLATSANLEKAILHRPEILHFAVHVVSPSIIGENQTGFQRQAALALSMSKTNVPELLTPEAIATLRVPGSLVVISGCSSQQGEILPGAGLMGLSRAWLLAGASAVVVSSWPTPDDSGQFFSSFYSHFDSTSGSLAQRAALALQRAQMEMEHGGGYRSAPRFWAAYSIISKE